MSDGGTVEDGSERPEGWPEMWLDPGPPCSHTFHWDDSDGGYVCLDCGEERDEPPERYITGTEQEDRR